jgi:hypothetical protein
VATRLAPHEAISIRLALEDLNSAFTYHLDHGNLDELIELFCEDAFYAHAERETRGRAAIRELFVRRTASSPRTSRHLFSGLRLDIESPSLATGTSCCLTFAADGLPPLPATPLLVADFDDVYRRCDDDKWRFQERRITRIFADPASPGPIGSPESRRSR